MFLGDRPTTPYDLNFRLLGVPVRVHPYFWLLAALLGPLQGEPKFMLMWVVVVFVSILVHEMGHALMIRSFGWRPSILLYSFGGLAMYQARQQDPRKQIAISLAGPAAGFLLAALTVLLARAMGYPVMFSFGKPLGINFGFDYEHFRSVPNINLMMLIFQLLEVNIWWGLINLLPVWPLDGGHVCYELLSELRMPQALPKALMVSVVVAVTVAIYAGVRLQDWWLALMFGYLAYDSYSTLASFQGRGGGYGGRW
ncbi:MAG TPA: site-2 protease family protein [Pirellulales bacterium]|nr:site-2 protease family protein [Pirellulales bacterium]